MKHSIMIKKAAILFFVLAGTAPVLFAQTDTLQTLTLQQCIQIALKNNEDVQRQEITSDIAKTNWQGSKGYMIPTLGAGISHGINTGRNIDPYTNTYANQKVKYGNYNLNTSVTLFNFFAVQNNIKQNKLAFDASGFEIQNQKDIVAMNVILQYLQVLTNNDLLTASTQQSEVSAKQVERLNVLNDDGAVSPNELYDLKGEYANNQLSVVNAENQLQTAKIALAQLLNMPFNKNLQLEKLGFNDFPVNTMNNTDSIYQVALHNLAVIKAAELRNKSAVFGVKTSRSQSLPSLYFNGGVFTNYSGNASIQNFVSSTVVETGAFALDGSAKLPVYTVQDNYTSSKIPYGSQFKNNFNSSFSIGISIPILNNFNYRTQIKTAKYQQKDAAVILNAAKTRLQQNVEQAYVNVTSAQRRYDVLNGQVAAYQESFRVAEIKFNAGAINSVEYLITKNNLDQANMNLIIAKYDYVLRSMLLDYYSGKLTFNQ